MYTCNTIQMWYSNLNRSAFCPICHIRCIKVGSLFLSSINETVAILRNDLFARPIASIDLNPSDVRGRQEDNRFRRHKDLPTTMPRRILKRRATTGNPKYTYVDEDENRTVVAIDTRRSKRQRQTVSRWTYIICAVCKRITSVTTSLPLTMYDSYVCSIDCIKSRTK